MGTILIGPNTTFTIDKAFAEIAGGEFEFEFGYQNDEVCTVEVAPPLPLGSPGPPWYKRPTTIESDQPGGCKGIEFFGGWRQGKLNINDEKGKLKVVDQNGRSVVLKPGQADTITRGHEGAPRKFRLKSCSLQKIGFGVFC